MRTSEEPVDVACASSLLRAGAARRLADAYARYPAHYDDVLNDVHARLVDRGAARKFDLAALIAWKHVRNARWMKALLAWPDEDVEAITRRSFEVGLADADRIAELGPLPGFGGAGAFTSVLLTAWDPTRFGVFDRLVFARRGEVVIESCRCDWSHLPTYWTHLRVIARELVNDGQTGAAWSPRAVDMALMNLES